MLPLLPFHVLAAQRGDGLRPELLALFARDARHAVGLSAAIAIDHGRADETPSGGKMRDESAGESSRKPGTSD